MHLHRSAPFFVTQAYATDENQVLFFFILKTEKNAIEKRRRDARIPPPKDIVALSTAPITKRNAKKQATAETARSAV